MNVTIKKMTEYEITYLPRIGNILTSFLNRSLLKLSPIFFPPYIKCKSLYHCGAVSEC